MSGARVTVIGMHESPIERAAAIACEYAVGADLSRAAFVFGGKRPVSYTHLTLPTIYSV